MFPAAGGSLQINVLLPSHPTVIDQGDVVAAGFSIHDRTCMGN